jgi:hypothetical protein
MPCFQDKPTYTRIKRPQRLLEAATRWKEQGNNPPHLEPSHSEKYWSPDHNLPSPSINSKCTSKASLKSPISVSPEEHSSEKAKGTVETMKFRLDVRIPSIMEILASSVVACQGENINMSGLGVEQHVGGEMAMRIAISFFLSKNC